MGRLLSVPMIICGTISIVVHGGAIRRLVPNLCQRRAVTRNIFRRSAELRKRIEVVYGRCLLALQVVPEPPQHAYYVAAIRSCASADFHHLARSSADFLHSLAVGCPSYGRRSIRPRLRLIELGGPAAAP